METELTGRANSLSDAADTGTKYISRQVKYYRYGLLLVCGGGGGGQHRSGLWIVDAAVDELSRCTELRRDQSAAGERERDLGNNKPEPCVCVRHCAVLRGPLLHLCDSVQRRIIFL